LLIVALALGSIIGYEATGHARQTPVPSRAPGTTTPLAPQTQDLVPIFQCTGAGNEVLVSLGGDGSSIYVSCSKIKS